MVGVAKETTQTLSSVPTHAPSESQAATIAAPSGTGTVVHTRDVSRTGRIIRETVDGKVIVGGGLTRPPVITGVTATITKPSGEQRVEEVKISKGKVTKVTPTKEFAPLTVSQKQAMALGLGPVRPSVAAGLVSREQQRRQRKVITGLQQTFPSRTGFVSTAGTRTLAQPKADLTLLPQGPLPPSTVQRADVSRTEKVLFKLERATESKAIPIKFGAAGVLLGFSFATGVKETTFDFGKSLITQPIATLKGVAMTFIRPDIALTEFLKPIATEPFGIAKVGGRLFGLKILGKVPVKAVKTTRTLTDLTKPTKVTTLFEQFFKPKAKKTVVEPFEVGIETGKKGLESILDTAQQIRITTGAEPSALIITRTGKVKGKPIKEFGVKIGDTTFTTTQLGKSLIISEETGGVISGKVFKKSIFKDDKLVGTFKQPVGEPLAFESVAKTTKVNELIAIGEGAKPAKFISQDITKELFLGERSKLKKFSKETEVIGFVSKTDIKGEIIAKKKIVGSKTFEITPEGKLELTGVSVDLIPPQFVKTTPKLQPDFFSITQEGKIIEVAKGIESRSISKNIVERSLKGKGVFKETPTIGKRGRLETEFKTEQISKPSEILIEKPTVKQVQPSISLKPAVSDLSLTISKTKLKVAPLIATRTGVKISSKIGTKTKIATKTLIQPITKTKATQITKPIQIVTPIQLIEPITKVSTKTLTKTLTKTKTATRVVPTPTPTPPPLIPMIPTPISTVPTPPIVSLTRPTPRRKKPKREPPQSTFYPTYVPTVEAILLGIKGTRPTAGHIKAGLGFRPIIK